MKKLVFKKWVKWFLAGLMLVCILVVGGECENTTPFIVTKTIATLVFYLSFKLLIKFGTREVL